MASAPPERPRAQRVLAVLAAGLGTLLVGELGYRVWLRAAGDPYDASALRASIERRVEAMGERIAGTGGEEAAVDRTFLHPYYGFETTPGHEALSAQQAFARAAGADALRGRDAYVVLIVGGSVALAFGDATNGGTERLWEVLADDPRFADKAPIFLGHGRPAFKQPQQLMLVAYLFSLGLEPDAVINIDGFNEVALALANTTYGAHPVHPYFNSWGHVAQGGVVREEALEKIVAIREARTGARRTAARGLAWQLHRSAVLGALLERRIAGLELAWRRAYESYSLYLSELAPDGITLGPRFEEGDEAVLAAALENWVQSSLSLSALCAERGVLYAHALQPTLLDQGSKELTEEERAFLDTRDTFTRGVRAGYPLLRTAGARLRERGIAFVDASPAFMDVEETVYQDVCHFERPWTERLGQFIGEALLECLPEELPTRGR